VTPQQTFTALLQALRHCPEDQVVDTLLADLTSYAHHQLHQASNHNLKLACLTNPNPETITAADLLLTQRGFTLRFHPHDPRTHLVSIRRTHPSEGAPVA